MTENHIPSESARLRSAIPILTDRVAIGDLLVSPVCLAAVSTPQTILSAFDAGINFFLVAADMHWPNYEASRKGISELLRRKGIQRRDIVVAGISYAGLPAFSHAPFQELLDAVPGLERLDLTIIGGADDASFVSRRHEYQKHRTMFGTHAVGAVFHNDTTAVWCTNQNLVDMTICAFGLRSATASKTVLPFLAKHPRSPFYAFGSTLEYISREDCVNLGVPSHKWIPSPADYVRFAFSHEGVDGAVLHLQNESSVSALDAALREGALDANDVEYMNDLAELADGTARLASSEGSASPV